MKYPPRMGDLPREELVAAANRAMEEYARDGLGPEVHFKFTCEECGERCTLSAKNMLYERGECFKCGHETKIERGGFLMEFTIGGKPQ